MKNDSYASLYQDIKKLYNIVLNELVHLIKQYNFDTPLEISSLFYYLLSHNYLYINKQESLSFIFDDTDICGVNTILGNGVCRHKSRMLDNLFHRLGIDSIVIVGFLTNFLRITDYNPNENNNAIVVPILNECLNKNADSNTIFTMLEERHISYTIEDVEDDYYLYSKKSFPNHMIVLAATDKKYFIDPEIQTYYYLKKGQKITTNNRFGTHFFIVSPDIRKIISNRKLTIQEYQKIYNKPSSNESMDDLEIQQIISHIEKLRKYIQVFYKHNLDCYKEISKKCSIIKTKSLQK